MPLVEVKDLFVEIKGKRILNGISFTVSKGEFIVIMGPSGCGKTTLIKELAGENNQLKGHVRIDNLSIYENFHSKLKYRIGYVEQFNQLHNDLTVSQVLKFTAGIRRVKNSKQKIEQVIEQLKLDEHRHKLIKALSGGTAKRVAIAAELLSEPDLLLLDEPTSPLDPETIKEFLNVVHNLAKNLQKAIIMVTHKPTDLYHVDQVLFLSNGGYQVYFGPEANFLQTILAKLKLRRLIPQVDSIEDKLLFVYEKFKNSEIGKEIALDGNYSVSLSTPNYSKGQLKSFNTFVQLCWLIRRYFAVKFPQRERIQTSSLRKTRQLFDGWVKSIFSYLAQPILVGLLFTAFPFFNTTSLFLISLAVIWFGVNNSSKEIAEESHVFRRERSFNLKIDTYLWSKIIVLWIISIVQILVLLSVVWYRFHSVHQPEMNLFLPKKTALFLFVLSFSSINLGLLLSTISEKVDKVLIWVPIVLMAQIVFSGLVSKPDKKFKENLSYLMIGRWGLEGLARIQDSAAVKKHEIIHFKNPISDRDTTIDTLIAKSVVTDKILAPPNDTLGTDTIGALQSLASYNNKLKRDKLPAWTLFDSFKWNRLIILIHGFIYYFVCRLVLFKKDYIPYIDSFQPRKITLILHLLLFLLVTFIVLSPYFKDRIRGRDMKTEKDRIELLKWYNDLQKKLKHSI